ncbi:hypothetical protein [Baia soyae]|uniref:hypothetical protein n=1 Tax=Baia soyae TaxID=1544746 RepID=UPI00104349D3|nr:hypothetical protein [Baia soyae]
MKSKKIVSLICGLSLLSTSVISIHSVYALDSNTDTLRKNVGTEYVTEPTKSTIKEGTIGNIDLSKINRDLENQNEVFEKNKNNLFTGLSIDQITSLQYGDIIKRKVAKKLATNINATQPGLISEIEKLKETLNKDSYIEHKVENTEDVIKELITVWNRFTDRPLVKAVQLAAAKTFDLPYANLDRWKEDKVGEYESYIDTIGIILEEMKKETQSFLKSKGIKELTLFRGVKSSTKMNENGIDLQSSPALSSFSFSKGSSESYATTSDPNIHPYLLVKNVPVDRILSLGVTGFGLMEHYEIVVLGGMYSKDEFFVLPGKTGSPLKLFFEEQAKQLHEGGSLDLMKEMMSPEAGKQLKKHSEAIATQLDKIIKETPDSDFEPNIMREKIYASLIGEPLKMDSAIARDISNGLCPSIK